MPRGSSSRARADRRSRASSIVAPGRWRIDAARSPLVAASSSAWVVSPTGSRPASAAAARTAARSTVRGQVLAAQVAERVAADAVPGEPAQGAVAPPRGVQGRGLLRVVDEDDDPAVEAVDGAREPGLDAEADLGGLPVLELDPLVSEALGELDRRRVRLDPGEPARGVEPHQLLADAARTADDPVDGQRIEHLVRDDRADGRRRRPPGRPRRLERGSKPGRVEPRVERLEPRELDLHRPVADRLEQRGAGVSKRDQQALRERAGALRRARRPRRAPDARAPSTPPRSTGRPRPRRSGGSRGR